MRFNFMTLAGAVFAFAALAAAGAAESIAADVPAQQQVHSAAEGAAPLRKRGFAAAGQFADDVIRAVVNKGSDFAKGAAARGSSLGSKVVKAPGRFVSGTKSSLKAAGSNVGKFGRNAFDKVKTPVAKVITKIKEFIKQLPGKVRSAASTVKSKFSKGKVSASEVKHGVGAFAREQAGKVSGTFSQAGKFASDKVTQAGKFATDKVTQAGRFASDKASQAGRFASNKASQAGRFARDKASQAGGSLSRARQGVVNFASDKATKAGEAFNSVSNTVRTGAGNGFQKAADFVKPKSA